MEGLGRGDRPSVLPTSERTEKQRFAVFGAKSMEPSRCGVQSMLKSLPVSEERAELSGTGSPLDDGQVIHAGTSEVKAPL